MSIDRLTSDTRLTLYIGRVGLVAAAYFGAAKLGLALAFANSSVTAVWPPTGLALAAVVVWGMRMWPGIALGAFLANVTTQGSFLTVCGITTGNTLEALIGAFLLSRVDFRRDLSRMRDVVALVVLAAGVSTIASATIGVASLDADGLVRSGTLWPTWRVWWLGDLGGDVLVASAILVLVSGPQLPRRRLAGAEAIGLAVAVAGVSVIAFAGNGPRAYAILPLLFWAALRFGQPAAVCGGLIVAGIAVWFTKNGHGEFAGAAPDTALLRAQTFVGVTTVTALLVAAVRSEQRSSERRASELRQGAAIAGSLAEGVLMTRAEDARVVYANTAAEELFGYGPGELIGVNASELLPTRNGAGSWAFGEKGAARWSGELDTIRRDGARIWCYVNISEFSHPEYGPVLISAHSDITARKRAQGEAERLAEIVDSAADAIIRSDASGAIVSWNRGAERLFGYTSEEVLGKTGEFLVPEHLLAEREDWRKIVWADTAVLDVQTQRICKGGRLVDVMLTMSPITDETGRLIASSAILRDVTVEQRQANALREAEERFRGAFENAPIGMALVAPDGRWLRVNRAVCEIVGYSESELLARSFQDITHPDDLDADLEAIRLMLAGEIPTYQMDKRYIHRDGQIVWITLSVSLVHDARGEPLYFVSQIEDVTGRKRSQRALQATVEITHTVGGVTDLGRVLALIAERARALIDAASIVILLSDGDELSIAAAAGALDPAIVGRRVAPSRSIAGQVLQSGRAERVDRLGGSARFALSEVGVRATSALVVPLGFRGANLGVIEALDRASGPQFGEEDERLLLAIAASAGIAVATAQSAEEERLRRTLRGAEDERRRWARELHDETLQALGGLRVVLSSAQRSEDERVLRGVVRSALDQLDTEIESLRVLISELRPAALDELGLRAALLALGERTRVANGIDVRTTIDISAGAAGPIRFDSELETVVYRVVQEALSNAARHANPNAIDVRLTREDGALSVTIADDGSGFDPSLPVDGFGLLGMRERLSLVGGQFELTSSPQGTTVRISVPDRAVSIRASTTGGPPSGGTPGRIDTPETENHGSSPC